MTSNDASANGSDAGGDGSNNALDGSFSGPCTIGAVQAVPGTAVEQVIQQSPTSSQSMTNSAGNFLVAIAYGGQNPGQTTPPTTAPNMTFAVSDTQGNTYYSADMIQNPISNQSALQIFFAPNIKGGANTVTASSTTGGGAFTLWTGLLVQEYSGIATSDVATVSTARYANASTTMPSAGDMMTTSSCELVVGAFVNGHVSETTVAALPGWIKRSTDVWDPGGAVDNAGAPAPAMTNVNAGISLGGGADNGWVAAQIAFRGAGTQAPTVPSDIAFSTSSQTVKAGACSGPVTIITKGGAASAGVQLRTPTGMTAGLSGAGLTFYADSACMFPRTSAHVGAGSSSHTFYFTAANPGTVTITASPAGPGAAITQNETIN
jgi:hypothetical protein